MWIRRNENGNRHLENTHQREGMRWPLAMKIKKWMEHKLVVELEPNHKNGKMVAFGLMNEIMQSWQCGMGC
jgi:hypothetical protein